VRSLGLQKLFSASTEKERGSGEGEGDSDGQEVAESRYDPWLGWMYTSPSQLSLQNHHIGRVTSARLSTKCLL
jgi:hypothetical protein